MICVIPIIFLIRLFVILYILDISDALLQKLISVALSIGRTYKLTLTNKLIGYKVIIKPIWTYGIQLCCSASSSNIMRLQEFHSMDLRIITGASWLVSNVTLRSDLRIVYVLEEAKCVSMKNFAQLEMHPNTLRFNLLDNSKTLHRIFERA